MANLYTENNIIFNLYTENNCNTQWFIGYHRKSSFYDCIALKLCCVHCVLLAMGLCFVLMRAMSSRTTLCCTAATPAGDAPVVKGIPK